LKKCANVKSVQT